MNTPLIYLASPYSSSKLNPVEARAEQRHRFEQARLATASLLKRGLCVYSPIVYSHQFAVELDFGTDFGAWQVQDLRMLEACDELWVLTLRGWDVSAGISREVEHARIIGRRVAAVDPVVLEPVYEVLQ